MNRNSVFIHIGYQKTGTTTLQKHFFPIIDKIQYIGKFYNGEQFYNFDNKIINDLIFQNELVFAQNIKEYRKKIMNLLVKNKIVLSEESFLSNTMRPSTVDMYIISPCPAAIGRKLRRLFSEEFFDVKIIMTIRRQDEMITSQYAQSYTHYYSKYRQTNSFGKFLSYFIRTNQENNFKTALDYNLVHDEYVKIFGKDNVWVIAFELLQTEPKKFYEAWCELLEIESDKYSKIALEKEENKRTTSANYKKTRRMNLYEYLACFKQRYFGNSSIKLHPYVKATLKSNLKKIVLPRKNEVDRSISLNKEEKDMILRQYKKSNELLDDKLGLDLKKYGYYH